MTALTVCGLSDETRRALKLRAHKNGRSAEAEVRRIIVQAVQPQQQPQEGIGTRMAALRAKYADLGDFDFPVHRMDDAIRPVDFVA